MANNNFDLANLALQCVLPGNELLFDDKGMPSVMVRIPKCTYAELGLGSSTETFPAFIVNGVEKDAIWISKYQNIVVNGRAYSLPGKDPRASITFDTALAACTAKGDGWHLMTKVEWAALAWFCYKNGTMPNGNNDYGKDTAENAYRAIPSMERDSSDRRQRVATGTGPDSWSHDGTRAGIFDLNGNVWEWVGGIRTVKGEVQILANNNAAMASADQSASSSAWKAIRASDGALITPNGSGTTSGSIKMDFISSKCCYSTSITDSARGQHSCALGDAYCASGISDAAKLLLASLGMVSYETIAAASLGSDRLYFNNNEAERSFCCCGRWGSGAGAGVFASDGIYGRSFSYSYIGFRSAYYEA